MFGGPWFTSVGEQRNLNSCCRLGTNRVVLLDQICPGPINPVSVCDDGDKRRERIKVSSCLRPKLCDATQVFSCWVSNKEQEEQNQRRNKSVVWIVLEDSAEEEWTVTKLLWGNTSLCKHVCIPSVCRLHGDLLISYIYPIITCCSGSLWSTHRGFSSRRPLFFFLLFFLLKRRSLVQLTPAWSSSWCGAQVSSDKWRAEPAVLQARHPSPPNKRTNRVRLKAGGFDLLPVSGWSLSQSVSGCGLSLSFF